MKGLNIHVGKQHKIGDQLDGADDYDFKKDKGVKAEDPLLIFLQCEVAEYPDDELVPVGEKYWHLPEVFYFDKNIRSIRDALKKNCSFNLDFVQDFLIFRDFLGHFLPKYGVN